MTCIYDLYIFLVFLTVSTVEAAAELFQPLDTTRQGSIWYSFNYSAYTFQINNFPCNFEDPFWSDTSHKPVTIFTNDILKHIFDQK